MGKLVARILRDIPGMSATSVSPLGRWQGDDLAVGYFLSGDESCAVIRFQAVASCCLGPSCQGLNEHRLWGSGLERYEFHEVVLPEKDQTGAVREFVATFHDGSLEILAKGYDVIAVSVQASDPAQAMDAVLGPGDNADLFDMVK